MIDFANNIFRGPGWGMGGGTISGEGANFGLFRTFVGLFQTFRPLIIFHARLLRILSNIHREERKDVTGLQILKYNELVCSLSDDALAQRTNTYRPHLAHHSELILS